MGEPAAGRLTDRIDDLIGSAGYRADDPLLVGVQRGDAEPILRCRGTARTGAPLTAGTVVYTASLSKQVTAACAALLVRRGRLSAGSALGEWMPELPHWAGAVRLDQLISHTSGLPEGADFWDHHRAGADRTTAAVVGALTRLDHPAEPPGTVYRYCNAGYVCLAVAVERAAGRPLPDLAREQVFAPLGMTDSRFWPGPDPCPPGAAPLDPAYPAPLSLGDGGMWSTVPDLLRWNRAMNRDELGVAALVQTPGRLADGTRLGYAWGIDVREHAGRPVYRHGGSWAGLTAQLVRSAGSGSVGSAGSGSVGSARSGSVGSAGSGLVVVALDDDGQRTARLADALIGELADVR